MATRPQLKMVITPMNFFRITIITSIYKWHDHFSINGPSVTTIWWIFQAKNLLQENLQKWKVKFPLGPRKCFDTTCYDPLVQRWITENISKNMLGNLQYFIKSKTLKIGQHHTIILLCKDILPFMCLFREINLQMSTCWD